MFLRSNEVQSFPAQNNPTIQPLQITRKKLWQFYFLSFSVVRLSVALSTEIEFPLGTTSFYLAAWCCSQVNSNGVHFTKHLIQHCMCNCVCYMDCELHWSFAVKCVSGHNTVVCVLCWWVRDYLGLIGDNILAGGKNMEQGTPGKHQMQYSTK